MSSRNDYKDRLLVEQKALPTVRQDQLRQMVDWHIEAHGQNAAQSLAALSSVSSAHHVLQALPDPDLQLSLRKLLKKAEADVAILNDETLLEQDVAQVLRQKPSVGDSAGSRYQPLRPHARGGLGEVFVARDQELHREVALKEIQTQFAHLKDSRDRFVLEAEITGRLEHPGIVPVYGLGQYQDGRPFYAMRFIKGDSLKDAIVTFHDPDNPDGKDPGNFQFALRQLLRRFIDVCNAIAYAHSRGVLHRDLKPGNVMLGKYGETLVVDWGLAKSTGSKEIATDEATLRPMTALSSSGVTQPGSALGTPAYMSPEQALGKLDELGPPTDIYGLGATLYHLLTGKQPFLGPVDNVLQQVTKGQFRSPRTVNPQIPLALEAICLKAMSLKPADRYVSAKALADDVEHWLADEPVTAFAEPFSIRARRWVKKHQTAVSTLAAALLVTAFLMTFLVIVVTGKNSALAKANS